MIPYFHMKHLLTAASLALGACTATVETRNPTPEEQAIIDALVERGSYEHTAVSAMMTQSDATFFDLQGNEVSADVAAQFMRDAADKVVELHRNGKILVFEPQEETDVEIGGVADEATEGMSHTSHTESYIALNAQFVDRWSFDDIMHEGVHQIAPDMHHEDAFAELAEETGDLGTTQAKIAELAFLHKDFPYLSSVEYSPIDNILRDNASWFRSIASDIESRVESGELAPDAAVAEYDERTASAITSKESFVSSYVESRFTLYPDLFENLGLDEEGFATALSEEDPYAYVELQHNVYREGLETWLAEREEGERRVRRESEESHRTRRR